MADAPLSTRRDETVVERLIADSAARTELFLSAGRLVFATVLMVRFYAIGSASQQGGSERVWLVVPTSIVTVLLSALLAWRAKQRRLSTRWLMLSVFLDATGSFLGLVSNVLWPWEHYRGLLRMPDAAMIPVVVVIAGLRHSLSAAALGGALNFLYMAVLVVLDRKLNASLITYGWSEVSLFSVYVIAGAVASLAIAVRTRRLADRAADATSRAETARYSLALVLQDHHDVRSLLSSAQLNAGLLQRSIEEGSGATDVTRALERDLAELADLVGATRELAYAELAAAAAAVPVDAMPSIQATISALAPRFPAVSMSIERTAAAHGVRIVGGRRGLERMFLNLIVNACEGDGTNHASKVVVRVEPSGPNRVYLKVIDDGPGFSSAALSGHPARMQSSKPNGSGLGLFLVHRIVEASGGTLTLANLAPGASVTIELPAGAIQ